MKIFSRPAVANRRYGRTRGKEANHGILGIHGNILGGSECGQQRGRRDCQDSREPQRFVVRGMGPFFAAVHFCCVGSCVFSHFAERFLLMVVFGTDRASDESLYKYPAARRTELPKKFIEFLILDFGLHRRIPGVFHFGERFLLMVVFGN